MHFNLIQLLGLSANVLLVAAAPASAANNNEIYYLANCANCDIKQNGCQFSSSTMAYYPVEAKSENGESPSAIVSSSVVINWEGSTVQGQFSQSNIFTATIDKDARPKSLFTLVGSGKTAAHNFNCYRDQNRVLYKDGSTTCYAEYYCQWS